MSKRCNNGYDMRYVTANDKNSNDNNDKNDHNNNDSK